MALEKLKRYLKIRNRKTIRDNKTIRDDKTIRNNKTIRNKKTGKYIAAVISFAMMSFIVIYAGLFLYQERQSPEPGTGNGQNEGSSRNAGSHQTGGNRNGSLTAGDAVVYRHVATKINGLRQEINILEIDAGKPGVKVMPVLSNDMIYGFEYLSRMVSRKGAYAAVNGGFFSQYGLPSGMVAEDGKLIKASRGGIPGLYSCRGQSRSSAGQKQIAA